MVAPIPMVGVLHHPGRHSQHAGQATRSGWHGCGVSVKRTAGMGAGNASVVLGGEKVLSRLVQVSGLGMGRGWGRAVE